MIKRMLNNLIINNVIRKRKREEKEGNRKHLQVTSSLFFLMFYILDASAFINGKPTYLRGYTTPEVLSELKSVEANAYTWIIGERVKVEEPLPYFLKKVRKALLKIGETRLSRADVSVLALALQKRLPLVTDDYHLQNVALYLGLSVYDTGFGRIKRVVKYVWRCVGCGREYPPGTRLCPNCGSRVRPYSFVISVLDDTH